MASVGFSSKIENQQNQMGVSHLKKKAAFIDLDGVIIQSSWHGADSVSAKELVEVQVIPGVDEALHSLKKMGFLNFVITNQPDVSRKKVDAADIFLIRDYLLKVLPLDDYRACFHDDSDMCGCRKPKPGMIIDLAQEHEIELGSSILVGDRWRDIAAGQAVGLQSFFIDYSSPEKQPEGSFTRVSSLEEVTKILETEHSREQ